MGDLHRGIFESAVAGSQQTDCTSGFQSGAVTNSNCDECSNCQWPQLELRCSRPLFMVRRMLSSTLASCVVSIGDSEFWRLKGAQAVSGLVQVQG